MNALQCDGYSFTHSSAISLNPIQIVCTAFVDDTDLRLSANPQSSAAQTITRARQLLDKWNGLLHSTGGAIVARKSHWHWVQFIWTGSRWEYSPPPPDSALSILNYDTQQQERLQLISPHEGRHTLRVHVRPDGTKDNTVADLLLKSKNWADRLRTRPLPAASAWRALNTTILKTLEYPLPSTTLTPQQCNCILWPALQVTLTMSKIQRHFPRQLLQPRTYLLNGSWPPIPLSLPTLR